MRFRIYEGNMERLTKKMVRIQNKCKKYGCDFRFEEVGEEFKEIKNEYGVNEIIRFVIVEAEGLAIINNWEFIASMEHTEKGNIINRAVDVEVPERYYNGPCECEHCKTKRARKFTYIVRNVETNEFKQVGKSCLQDFTNGMSAEFAASCMDGVEELINGETPIKGTDYRTYTETKEMLLFFQECVNHFGYVRNTVENGEHSTANKAARFYRAYHNLGHAIWDRKVNEEARAEMKKIGFDHKKESVLHDVENALTWIENQEETNNYMHNLKVACANTYIPETGFALVASLIPTYNKGLEIEAIRKERERQAEKEKKSEYVGNVGEKIQIEIKTVKCITSYQTQFGITFVNKFTDKEGNVYIWKTGKDVEKDGAENKILVGTLKEHNEYKGVKQNVLTRCKIK